MAFPYVFADNFETGSAAGWTSETDTATKLDFPTYKELSRFAHPTMAPFRGGACMRAVLDGGTTDAFVTSTVTTMALDAVNYFRMYLWFSPDFTGTADDTFNLLELQSTGPVVEVALSGRIVAATNVINLGIGEVAATSWSGVEIQRGVWYCVELLVSLDAGGGNDGAIDLYITPEGVPGVTSVSATQVSTLDQAAIAQSVLGIQDHLATTTGTILFDEFAMDDARIFPFDERYTENVLLTQSGHAFVGSGKIKNVSLLSGGTADNVLSIFDTDIAYTSDPSNIVAELKNTAGSELVDPAGMPVRVTRGAYVQLSGTNPRALVQIGSAVGYGSPGAVRSLGARR